MEKAIAGSLDRTTYADDGPVEKAVRMSEVAEASERLDSALERLTSEAGMLEDRLAHYLRKTDEGELAEALGDPRTAAASQLHRQASAVERVAMQLSELRSRFEG